MPGGRQRLSPGQRPRNASRSGHRRCLAGRVLVARRWPDVAEHGPRRFPAGHVAGGPGVPHTRIPGHRGSHDARRHERPLLLQRHRLQSGSFVGRARQVRRDVRESLHRRQQLSGRHRAAPLHPHGPHRQRHERPVPGQALDRRGHPAHRRRHVHDSWQQRRARADRAGRQRLRRLQRVHGQRQQRQLQAAVCEIDELRRDVEQPDSSGRVH